MLEIAFEWPKCTFNTQKVHWKKKKTYFIKKIKNAFNSPKSLKIDKNTILAKV
jgi:hypothetical protein